MAFVNGYGYQPAYGTYLPQQGAMQGYGAQQYAQQMSGMQMAQQPQQQAAPIIWVQGEAGAKSFLVGPGQSVMLMDSEAEVFYIKATDASGVPLPLRAFDYKERTTGAQRPVQAAQTPSVEYVTRAEFEAFVAKLAQMTAQPAQRKRTDAEQNRRLKEMEGEIDA